jgi:hypothetical protein
MKANIQNLLRDIKAAARIGHTESVWAALDGILDYPQISGNHHLDETFLREVVVPIGQSLAQPLLNQTTLRPLIVHTLAGMRAVAGAALAERYLKGINGVGLKELNTLAQDPRQDVRDAVLLACAMPISHASGKQTELFDIWLANPSPRLQGLAFQLLPYLPENVILQQIRQLEDNTLPQEPGVRRSLAEAVSKVGRGGDGLQALEVLSGWAENPDRYYWVITRCLSRSWAANYPKESLAILTQLAATTGGRKKILSTLDALQRHGAKKEVQSLLQDWLTSGQSQLQSAAEKASDKSKRTKDKK